MKVNGILNTNPRVRPVPYKYSPSIKMLQFLKLSLVLRYPLGITLFLERGMKMAKKVYHLTISYDESDDTIEYICETLDEETTDHTDMYPHEASVPGFSIVRIDIGKYFDEPTFQLIKDCNEIGEA